MPCEMPDALPIHSEFLARWISWCLPYGVCSRSLLSRVLLVPVCSPLSAWHHEYRGDGTPDSTHLCRKVDTTRSSDQSDRRSSTDCLRGDSQIRPRRASWSYVMRGTRTNDACAGS